MIRSSKSCTATAKISFASMGTTQKLWLDSCKRRSEAQAGGCSRRRSRTPRRSGGLVSRAAENMRYRYFICDVFTDTRFGGNQLAVLPEAQGLSDRRMQQIAREFNFSESTFVFPPEAGHTRKVRIFTPSIEVPFAGHPNVGTAFVLATAGELGPLGPETTVTFEEKAGLVPI